MLRNSFCNANGERDLRFESFFDARGCKGWRDEDDAGVGSSFFYSFRDVLEHWETKMGRSGLCLQSVCLWSSIGDVFLGLGRLTLGIRAANNLGAVLDRLLSMECTLLSCKALENDLGVRIDPQITPGLGVW